ncbi:MAG: hypothetical protein AAFV19_11260 [Pseudomonadota bacterium]
MKSTRRSVISGVAALTASFGWPAASETSAQIRVLFIGNSFIIEHDVPSMFADIARQAGHTIVVDMIADGGASLSDVLADRAASDVVYTHDPDLIVLQDYSTVALYPDRAERSHAALRAFCNLSVRRILFATWPRAEGHKLYRREGMPSTPAEMMERVERHYTARVCPDLAGHASAQVAPVGRAWMLGTGLPLHRGDGYHASRTGAWLSALVLARTAGLAPDRPEPPYGVKSPGTLIRIAQQIVP